MSTHTYTNICMHRYHVQPQAHIQVPRHGDIILPSCHWHVLEVRFRSLLLCSWKPSSCSSGTRRCIPDVSTIGTRAGSRFEDRKSGIARACRNPWTNLAILSELFVASLRHGAQFLASWLFSWCCCLVWKIRWDQHCCVLCKCP